MFSPRTQPIFLYEKYRKNQDLFWKQNINFQHPIIRENEEIVERLLRERLNSVSAFMWNATSEMWGHDSV